MSDEENPVEVELGFNEVKATVVKDGVVITFDFRESVEWHSVLLTEEAAKNLCDQLVGLFPGGECTTCKHTKDSADGREFRILASCRARRKKHPTRCWEPRS